MTINNQCVKLVKSMMILLCNPARTNTKDNSRYKPRALSSTVGARRNTQGFNAARYIQLTIIHSGKSNTNITCTCGTNGNYDHTIIQNYLSVIWSFGSTLLDNQNV